MKQAARELTNFEDGFLNGKRYLLMDRDGKFCESFRAILKDEGIESVKRRKRYRAKRAANQTTAS